ncbi:hypothetical protein [Actinomadura luteofluorescens]|uniref:hypothetical protein n=1 Tax=Actinomadura luteofluorescens TaxID=46163 RepID=UPI003D8E5BE8
MSAPIMTCTACEREIGRGDKYVAVTRQTERVGLLGAVKVEDAELVAAYHPSCAPRKDTP